MEPLGIARAGIPIHNAGAKIKVQPDRGGGGAEARAGPEHHRSSGAIRRIPIAAVLMTAIAALGGLLPLVEANGAGAHSQQSLGTVIFGDLVVATVLSLGVVP